MCCLLDSVSTPPNKIQVPQISASYCTSRSFMTENLLLGKNHWLETSPKDPRKIKTNPEPKTQFPTSQKLSSIEPLWDGSELNSKWVLFVQASPQSFGGFEGESRNSTEGKTLNTRTFKPTVNRETACGLSQQPPASTRRF